MKRVSRVKLVAATFSILILFCTAITSAEKKAGKILFLTLEFSQTSVKLLSSEVVEGNLKQPKTVQKKSIHYELALTAGKMLNGSIDDPLVRRFEYENPDKPGEFKNKVINLNKAITVLRVPYSQQIEKISFFRVESTNSTIKPARSLIGTVELSAIRGEER